MLNSPTARKRPPFSVMVAGIVTGFVTPDGKVWGRPVGITVAKDGSLIISEDGDKTIWRVSYSR